MRLDSNTYNVMYLTMVYYNTGCLCVHVCVCMCVHIMYTVCDAAILCTHFLGIIQSGIFYLCRYHWEYYLTVKLVMKI